MVRQSLFTAKSWGSEREIVNNDLYCGKRMEIRKGHYSSVHYHKMKSETFYVFRGKLQLEVWRGDATSLELMVLSSGDCYDVPSWVVHRFYGLTDCEFFEFSTPHSDRDVYRIMVGGEGKLPEVVSLEVDMGLDGTSSY